ncbi:MAG: SDR family NAD(P)-dependent oxidoreductase [Rhodospirillaceae bacterium]|nr:MAG: SDR family NAD(P)-dependent oxidoreductase [Rhodospirillaceae bacterium]
MTIRFDGQVAVVTGAGNGLGRSHALALAARGAKVVVNDLGVNLDGSGLSPATAETVVEEIERGGGEAMANGANVADEEQVRAMIADARQKWGRVDILVNNAGILRDKTFAKVDLADFRLILEVHLMGAVNCCKAVWDLMQKQNYGRIVMTTSGAGLYGNFGQSSYATAKVGMIGLMNVLHLEGAKHNIRVNALAPTAATRLIGGITPELASLLRPEAVTAGLLYLVSQEAPSQTILCAGAGVYAMTRFVETEGVCLPDSQWTPEAIAARFGEITDMSKAAPVDLAYKQTERFLKMVASAQR